MSHDSHASRRRRSASSINVRLARQRARSIWWSSVPSRTTSISCAARPARPYRSTPRTSTNSCSSLSPSRRAARVRNPRALGSHPSGATGARMGYRVITPGDAGMLPATTTARRPLGDRSRSAALAHRADARPYRGLDVLPSRWRFHLFSGDVVSGGPGNTSRGRQLPAHHRADRVTPVLAAWTPSCIRHGKGRPSVLNDHTCKSGSTGW